MIAPKRSELQTKILEYLKDEEFHTITAVTDEMAKYFSITDTERKELTLIAKRPKFNVMVGWAVSELRQAMLLENADDKRGTFKITSRGLEAIQSSAVIDTKYLKQFSEYVEWKENTDNVKKINKNTEKKPLTKKFGLVAYIDALGTKEMWKDRDPQKILMTWNKFITNFEVILKLTFRENETKITFNSFSDTLIITLENKDVNYLLKKFGFAVWSLIVQSIRSDMPVRGCFAIGTFYNKKNFFIGEAISEAAQYYELPQWVGISASPSANAKIEALSKQDHSISNIYHKCSIPLKRSIEQKAWAVNWPGLNNAMNITNERNEPSTLVLDAIDWNLEQVKNIDIALKWRNTKKFYEDVLNNF